MCSAYKKYSRRSHQLQIPEFVWHVCIENALPFEIQDTSIMVTPFLVHHGRLFTSPATLTPLSAPPAPSSVEKAETQIALNDVTPGIDLGQDPKRSKARSNYTTIHVFRIPASSIILLFQDHIDTNDLQDPRRHRVPLRLRGHTR